MLSSEKSRKSGAWKGKGMLFPKSAFCGNRQGGRWSVPVQKPGPSVPKPAQKSGPVHQKAVLKAT